MKNKYDDDLIRILSKRVSHKVSAVFCLHFILLAVMLLACANVHAKSYMNFSLIWNYQILYCFNVIYIADTARHLCNLTQYIHAIR